MYCTDHVPRITSATYSPIQPAKISAARPIENHRIHGPGCRRAPQTLAATAMTIVKQRREMRIGELFHATTPLRPVAAAGLARDARRPPGRAGAVFTEP